MTRKLIWLIYALCALLTVLAIPANASDSSRPSAHDTRAAVDAIEGAPRATCPEGAETDCFPPEDVDNSAKPLSRSRKRRRLPTPTSPTSSRPLLKILPPSSLVREDMLVVHGQTEVYMTPSGKIAMSLSILNKAAPSRQEVDNIIEQLMFDPSERHVFSKNSGTSAVWTINGRGLRITVAFTKAGFRATMTQQVLAQYLEFMMAHRDRAQSEDGWSTLVTDLVDISVRGMESDSPPPYSEHDELA